MHRAAPLLALLLASCHWLLPFGTGSDASDGLRPSGRDRPADALGGSEAGPAREASTPESRDARLAPRDVRPDAPRVREVSIPEAALVMDKPALCSLSACSAVPNWVDMAICQSPPLQQKGAEAACTGKGLRLCKASEYVLRGGGHTAPKLTAWLAGCLLPSGPPLLYELDEAVCSGPVQNLTANLTDCNGNNPPSLKGVNVGVAASTSCYPLDGSKAYWEPLSASTPLGAVVCCCP